MALLQETSREQGVRGESSQERHLWVTCGKRYRIAASLHISHDKYIVSYLKSGQPTTHVTEKLFSKSQIENDSNIVKAILEQEGENQ